MNNSNILEMRYVGIVVNNLQKSLDFFVNVLEFIIFKKMNEKANILTLFLILKKQT